MGQRVLVTVKQHFRSYKMAVIIMGSHAYSTMMSPSNRYGVFRKGL